MIFAPDELHKTSAHLSGTVRQQEILIAPHFPILAKKAGNQSTSEGWITTLTEAKIEISMDDRGRYLSNIFIERR